ncbi:MAG TPA: FtsX-like permease family protein [Opitutaceae bacterium]|nr:FtsX-like permease family protein [Opitutaceae bacterium]
MSGHAALKASLFWRTTIRHWRTGIGQFLLMLGLLSLGVGVFVSVRLANRAALASFSNFADTLTGQSDWILQPLAGTLPASALGELRAALGSRPADLVGVVETSAPLNNSKEQNLHLLGVDLFVVTNLAEARRKPGAQDQRSFESDTADFAHDQIWVSPLSRFAKGQAVSASIGDRTETLRVAGFIPTLPGQTPAPANLAVMDLMDVQRLSGKSGQLDRIEIVIEGGHDEDAVRREVNEIATRLGAGRWTVEAPAHGRESANTMTAAFRLNLTVLSLIALLVGLYLIFQTLDGAVVRRRTEIAILRALGVPAGWIQQLWLAEAAVLGLLAGIIGAGLGWIGAQGSVQFIGRSINTLYFETSARSATLDFREAVIAIGLGVASSLFAGWYPARIAAKTPPAQSLARHAWSGSRQHLRNAIIGAALIGLGVVASWIPPYRPVGGVRFPLGGYAAAFLWIFGVGVVTATALPLWAWLVRGLGGRSVPGRVASSYLRFPTTRHRFSVAALVCAIGMAAGMAILIASFEGSIRGWIQQSLQSDLYLTSKATTTAHFSPIDRSTVDRIAADPAVASIATRVYQTIVIDGLSTTLGGLELKNPTVQASFRWLEKPRKALDSYDAATSAFVSESFSDRFRKYRGDEVSVPTPSGLKRVTIGGVYSDYASERGTIAIDEATVQTWFKRDSVTHIATILKPGADATAVRLRWAEAFPGLIVYENASLRGQILEVFRQTFSLTYALEVIGVVVAISSLAITLASVLMERRDQLTTLRALGFSRRELALSACGEGVAIAGCAVVGGLLLSLALGWLLIHVINKQSFGWTLGFELPAAPLVGLAVSTVFVSAIVSYAVGRWGAGLRADREE